MEIINLNLIPGKAWPVAHATQFDKGREFRANLFEGSQVYTLEGDETVDAIIKKLDGNQVIDTLVNTADNYVIVTTTEQMTAVAGPSLGEIRITKDDTVIGSLKFILECEQSADTGIESHSEINNLETQVAAIVADQYDAGDVVFDSAPTAGHGVGFAVTSEGVLNAIPDELNDLSDVTITSPSNGEILVFDGAEWVNQANPASTANFAADYDDTATYNTNDKVIYNGLYYIALEDSITGAWDSTKWALTTVSALTAEELPLSGNDNTPTATAIGDLSQLTTSDKSSLVGAVNKVNTAISYKEYVVQIGTSLWNGVYYAETNVATDVSNYGEILSALVIDESEQSDFSSHTNRACFCQVITPNVIRLYSPQASNASGHYVKYRVTFSANAVNRT